MNQTAFGRMEETRVVAILRGIEESYLEETLEALFTGGIRCVEITLNTPGALRMIEKAKARYNGALSVGAGTVLEEVSAREAILAGADFVLAPTLNTKVIEICNLYGCIPVPGAFTPTEVLSAWQAGAPIVKVFPCSSVGPSYLKDLQGPLPQIRLMAVGGITLANTPDFFVAGAFAIGVGSSLFDPRLMREKKFDLLSERAQGFLKAARHGL